VKPLAYPLLADENIHPEVVRALAAQGFDITSVRELNLKGSSDEAVLRVAHAQHRVVVTHDSDFGRLAIQSGAPFTGIIFVRPGHISASFVLDALLTMHRADIDANTPFMLVVERRGEIVRARLR
jgi:predicted nuclease of predicted toxin-antitoxin system